MSALKETIKQRKIVTLVISTAVAYTTGFLIFAPITNSNIHRKNGWREILNEKIDNYFQVTPEMIENTDPASIFPNVFDYFNFEDDNNNNDK